MLKSAQNQEPKQLQFESIDIEVRLTECKTPQEAFDFAFSKEFLIHVYDNYISLKRTRGVDGITTRIFEDRKHQEIKLILKKIKNGTYHFTPYLEVLKSKGRGEVPRVLSIPTIRDRLTLFCLKEFIHYLYQGEIPRNHPNEHISRLCNMLQKNPEIARYYRGDLKNFYPSIPRRNLLNKLRKKFDFDPYINLIESALRTPTNALSKRGVKQEGVPQGIPISNVLADIYLLDLDRRLLNGRAFYGRFVDDIVIAGSFFPLMIQVAYLKVWIYLNGLRLGKVKSKFGFFSDGIDYLGYHIKRLKGRSQIYVGVRDVSQGRLIDSLCGLITSYKTTKDQKHLDRLDRRVSGVIWKNKRYGWLFYFSELNDLSILRRFDSIIANLKKRAGIGNHKVKKFTNTYWRIRKKQLGSYIVNFDKFSIDEMKMFLVAATGKTLAEIEQYSYKIIERMFALEVQKEVDRMEQDIGDMS